MPFHRCKTLLESMTPSLLTDIDISNYEKPGRDTVNDVAQEIVDGFPELGGRKKNFTMSASRWIAVKLLPLCRSEWVGQRNVCKVHFEKYKTR